MYPIILPGPFPVSYRGEVRVPFPATDTRHCAFRSTVGRGLLGSLLLCALLKDLLDHSLPGRGGPEDKGRLDHVRAWQTSPCSC